MIRIQNNSDTVIILVHEIYGINDHIKQVCNRFAAEKYDVLCPNLLINRQASFNYSEELIAYRYFTQNVGFSLAQQKVEKLSLRIRDQYRFCFIVGYSIGATIAWLCSQHEDLYNGGVGFYGSRIRDHKEVDAKCPMLLFFPRTEENFDVDCLMQDLSIRKNVIVEKVNALHGFADPWSSKYCKETSEKLFAKTIDFIENCKVVKGN